MGRHYEGLADQVVNRIRQGRAAMSNRRAQADSRHKWLAESAARTRGQMERCAEDGAERKAERGRRASEARAERAAGEKERTAEEKERIAGARQAMQGYRGDSTQRARAFQQVLAAGRAARAGRGRAGKSPAPEHGGKASRPASRGGRRAGASSGRRAKGGAR